ncbi:MAG: ABC transporter permease, partial [Bacteriovoracaceae bacterium]
MNIYAYIFRRLLYVIPILLGVCAIIFVLFNVVSPDPTLIMLGKHASVEQMESLRRELGLDRPYYAQYL